MAKTTMIVKSKRLPQAGARDFDMGRVCFCELALQGKLPGDPRASW